MISYGNQKIKKSAKIYYRNMFDTLFPTGRSRW